ncbi:MAG: DNA (cytosine-5-)-methyltransferase [Acidimicrobiales bacterium]|nr:DNA (cytosine-5-)-methyltransferase [Acidimicrobiales bacterium]
MAKTAVEKGAYGVKLVRGPFVVLPRHAEAVDDVEELPAVALQASGPLAADLFCGAGGLSLGLADAGYTVILGVDNDEDALATHRAYHPGLSANWDLGDEAVVERTGELIRDLGIQLVAGGPPCQPFSKAGRSGLRDLVRTGRRDARDKRSELWQSFLRIVSIARPQAVLMENVPDMALDRDMLILRTMADELEHLGYSVETRVVDTWRYGVPQHRQRLILVALADRVQFEWPAEHAQIVTLGNAISDLPPVDGGWRPEGGADGWADYDGPRTSFQEMMREHVRTDEHGKLFDHITRPVREDDLQIFENMDSKTKYSDIDPELRRYRHDIFDDKYKRLDYDDLSRTITAHIAKDGYWYIHPEQHRTISVREAARIQTFPDHIRFSGPPTAAFRQIGNAVPPRLGFELGTAIRRSLEAGHEIPHSRSEVGLRLARWFMESTRGGVPWLDAPSRWVVLQCEILWPRLGVDQLGAAYKATLTCATPQQTLENEGPLRRIATVLGRGPRVDDLVETAAYFIENPDGLDPEGPSNALAKAPNVSPALATLAARIVPGSSDDPVIVNQAVLRVAARYQGTSVDQRNKLSDGRLAVAAMIGGDDLSHEAHLALLEIGQTVCGPAKTDCAHCPLEADCVMAADLPVQQSLVALTSPEP